MASTLAVAGVVTANAGVVVDNITIDGTEIDLSSGDLTLDVAGDIILDADGEQINFSHATTLVGQVDMGSNNFTLRSKVSDADFSIHGTDGGSNVVALTLDMSAAGAASFNSTINGLTLAAGSIATSTSQNFALNTPNSLRINIDSNNSATDQVFVVGHNRTDVGTTSSLLVIQENGDVGIGQTSPDSVLHLKDPTSDTVLTMEGGASDANCRINFQNSGGTFRGMLSYDTDDNNLQFNVNDAERMRINSNGRQLGFTTTNLDPGDTPTDANCYVIGPGYMFLNRDDTASVDSITFGKNGSVAGRITTTSSTTYTTTSDYRRKENITPVLDGLERVQKLNPVSYTWIDDEAKIVEEGFLAHEVQEAGWETGVSGTKDGEDVQSMDYGRITPLLVKAIQEQQTTIENLTARLNTLEG
tara:strand:- start:103 stop:1350 length:1248 start_codon:yes stop_codon:yes gene_type:complete